MKNLLIRGIVVASLIFIMGGNVYGASLDGDPSYIAFENWLPINPCVTFYYVNDKVDGVEVSFKIRDGGTRLYKNWLVRLNDGSAVMFPFILEVTLIINDGNALWDPAHSVDQWARETQGEYWDFGLDGQCIETPKAYLDTHLSDDGAEKFGIGILRPYALQEGKTYRFWIKLKQQIDNISNITYQLRFRLNINVGEAHQMNYWPGSDFDLGGGWEVGYYSPYGGMDPQMIAESASFAITQFHSQNSSYSGSAFVSNVPIANKPIINTYCQ